MMKGAEPIFIDKKSKTGIFMLHGFTSTPQQFKDLAVFLSERGFSVYAPLIAGHGTHPEDLIKTGPDDWCRSVKEAYLKFKEIAEKIVVLGNSFGGNLAFWLAKEVNNELAGIATLGAPIFLKHQWFILLRLRTYGRFKKYYHKPKRFYKTDYIDMFDEITYDVIPVKSINDFLRFLKKETMPNLKKVKVPVLIAYASVDPVIHLASADYIFENIGSSQKEKYIFQSNEHFITDRKSYREIFNKAYDFIKKVSSA